MPIVSTKNSDHYTWGGTCDGWHLAASKNLSVIRERVSKGSSETRHLTSAQEERNTLKSKIRSKVEHVFGFMTNSMNNGLNLKAIGKKRIDSLIALLNLTYNLFRYEQLVRLQKVPVM